MRLAVSTRLAVKWCRCNGTGHREHVDHCVATPFVWRPLLSGGPVCLAAQCVWRPSVSGGPVCLAAQCVWRPSVSGGDVRFIPW